MDTFFHNLVISALRFPVSIVTMDFSWDDCNTQETLETTKTNLAGGGGGGTKCIMVPVKMINTLQRANFNLAQF